MNQSVVVNQSAKKKEKKKAKFADEPPSLSSDDLKSGSGEVFSTPDNSVDDDDGVSTMATGGSNGEDKNEGLVGKFTFISK